MFLNTNLRSYRQGKAGHTMDIKNPECLCNDLAIIQGRRGKHTCRLLSTILTHSVCPYHACFPVSDDLWRCVRIGYNDSEDSHFGLPEYDDGNELWKISSHHNMSVEPSRS